MTDAVRSGFPLYSILSPLYLHGSVAVEVFWCISGCIFFWKYIPAIKTRAISGYEFSVLRLSRLYPLHLATLIAVMLLQLMYVQSHESYFVYDPSTVPRFLQQLAMASNWLPSEPLTFNGPIWSISAEVATYAVFFLVAKLRQPSLVLGIAAFFACYLIARVSDDPVASCSLFFFAGGCVFLLLDRLETKNCKWAFIVAAALNVAVVWKVYKGHFLTLNYKLAFACSTLMLFLLVETTFAISAKRLAWLGNLTYSSYLLHFPLQLCSVLVVDSAGLSRQIFLSPVALVLFLSVTMVLAWLAYRFFERPAQDAIRNYWVIRRSRVLAQPAGP